MQALKSTAIGNDTARRLAITAGIFTLVILLQGWEFWNSGVHTLGFWLALALVPVVGLAWVNIALRRDFPLLGFGVGAIAVAVLFVGWSWTGDVSFAISIVAGIAVSLGYWYLRSRRRAKD